MRYQDLEAAEDLLEQAADAEAGHLSLARVGEDRKESQLARHPCSPLSELANWLQGAIRRTNPGQDGVKLRLRLWDESNRAVRGVTFKAWDDTTVAVQVGDPSRLEPGEALPAVHGEVLPAAVGELSGAAPPSARFEAGPPVTACPGCAVLQASLLAARMDVAQLTQRLRQDEERLWRMQQEAKAHATTREDLRSARARERELAQELQRHREALRRVKRENARMAGELRDAMVLARMVNEMEL